jgi:hypothetical protein
VWHHDIEGKPTRSDFMDADTVRRLIDRGFQVGFHGHSHKSTVAPVETVAYSGDTMVLIGAGSLGAGAQQRPAGYFRQYNVVAFSDDLHTGRVHIREMEIPGVFRGGREITMPIPFRLEQATRDQVVDASRGGGRILAKVEIIERLIREGRPEEALGLLTKDPLPGEYARHLTIAALRAAGRWSELKAFIGEARSEEEFVTLVEALVSSREWAQALEAIDRAETSATHPAVILRDLRERVLAKRGLAK